MSICIEGVDAVGKTTVSKKLADAIGGQYYKTPLRSHADKRVDPIGRFHFYLKAVRCASREIYQLCNTASVVCDRYICSIIAYHTVLDDNLQKKWDELFPSLPFKQAAEVMTCGNLSSEQMGQTMPILLPDCTILLVTSEKERQRRFVNRQEKERRHESALEEDSKLLAQAQEEFLSMGLDVINTTRIDADSVVQRIRSMIDL